MRSIVSLACLAAVAGLGAASAAGAASKFNGYNERFNLGQGSSGLACSADRDFENTLAGHGARAWRVSCLGYEQPMGWLYVLPGQSAEHAWRVHVETDITCAHGASQSGLIVCRRKSDQKPWALTRDDARRVVAEGYAAVGEMLVQGVEYMAGRKPEPAPTEHLAAAPLASTIDIAAPRALDRTSPEAANSIRLRQAYELGHLWQFDVALRAFGEVADSVGPNPSTRALARQRVEALYNQALQASNEGRFDDADAFLSQAQAREGDDSSDLATLRFMVRAFDARNRGRFREAVDEATQALALSDQEAAGSLVLASSGEATLAPEEMRRVRAALALEVRSSSEIVLGQRDAALADARRALDLLSMPHEVSQPVDVGPSVPRHLRDVDPLLAATLEGDIAEALAPTERASALTRFASSVIAYDARYPATLPGAFLLIQLARSQAALAATDPAEGDRALDNFEKAFPVFVAQRGGLGASADLAEPYFDLLIARMAGDPAAHPKDVARFFKWSQALVPQASARLAQREAERVKTGNGREAALANTLLEIERRLSRNVAEVQELEEKGALAPDVDLSKKTERDALELEKASVESDLAEIDPGYMARVQEPVIEVDDLKAILAPRSEAYVKLFALARRSYALFVTHDYAIAYSIDLDRASAAQLIRRVRDPIDHLSRDGSTGLAAPRIFDADAAQDAYAKLFEKVASQMADPKLRHLIVEPDATFIGLPLAALVTDPTGPDRFRRARAEAMLSPKPLDYSGLGWLVDRFSTSVALSPAAFRANRHAKPYGSAGPDRKLFLGFADPKPPARESDPRVFAGIDYRGAPNAASEARCRKERDLVPEELPGSAEALDDVAYEIGARADKEVGKDFTDSAILRDGKEGGRLSKYSILFFFTHGVLPNSSTSCVPSALVTSLDADPASDALLDVDKIAQLRLSADLVVLAACDTARTAEEPASTEALGGLIQSFVAQGARNVIASNWSVSPKATADLMKGLFKPARSNLSQSDALAETQRDMLKTPRRSNPYYWAAFMVVGDGANPMPTGAAAQGAAAGPAE